MSLKIISFASVFFTCANNKFFILILNFEKSSCDFNIFLILFMEFTFIEIDANSSASHS